MRVRSSGGENMAYKAGQSWSYCAPEGFQSSRLVIVAIATFDSRSPIICCTVTNAPQRQADGSVEAVTIPFLPLSEEAFTASIVACDEGMDGAVASGFVDGFEEWRVDPRGLSCFTVAFDGYLDRLIAHQMAAIVGADVGSDAA